jgi:hypothetical protein
MGEDRERLVEAKLLTWPAFLAAPPAASSRTAALLRAKLCGGLRALKSDMSAFQVMSLKSHMSAFQVMSLLCLGKSFMTFNS